MTSTHDEIAALRAEVERLKQADAAIAERDAEIERLRKREAHLFETLKRCERDVQRALRQWRNDNNASGFRTACEAIQQRAAGVGEKEE